MPITWQFRAKASDGTSEKVAMTVTAETAVKNLIIMALSFVELSHESDALSLALSLLRSVREVGLH